MPQSEVSARTISLFLQRELPELHSPHNAFVQQFHAQKPAADRAIIPQAKLGPAISEQLVQAAMLHRLSWSLADPEALLPIEAESVVVPDGNSVSSVFEGMRVARQHTRISHGKQHSDTLFDTGLSLLDTIHRARIEYSLADRAGALSQGMRHERYLAKLAIGAALFTEVNVTGGTILNRTHPFCMPGHRSVAALLGNMELQISNDIAKQVAQVDMASTTATMRSLATLRQQTVPDTCRPEVVVPSDASDNLLQIDLLAADTALKINTTQRPYELQTEDLRTLAAYCLTDIDDQLGITRVGCLYTRSGFLAEMEVEEFLAGLGSTKSAAELRDDLRAALRNQHTDAASTQPKTGPDREGPSLQGTMQRLLAYLRSRL